MNILKLYNQFIFIQRGKSYEKINTYDEKGSSSYQYYYDINRKLIPNNIDNIQFFCDEEGIKMILNVVAIAGPESHYKIYKLNDYIN